MTWADRKRQRIEHFWRHKYRFQQRKCSACNGSGKYDDGRGRDCGGCDGTRDERVRSIEAEAEARAHLANARITNGR